MNLLALDTSTDACTVALYADGDILEDHRLAPRQHGILIMPMIDALMAQAAMAPGDLDGIVYGRGPGSFTGVRIGVAVTQGIALGVDVGVVGISTLQSLAQYCQREFADREVAVSVDARMDEVYFSHYAADAQGLMQPQAEEQLLSPEAMAVACGQTVWVGSGAERYAALIHQQADQHSEGFDVHIRPDGVPYARDILTLGLAVARRGDLQPAEQAMPIYLRNKVALTQREQAALSE